MPAGALIFLVVLLIFAGLDVFLVVTLFHPGDERGQLMVWKAGSHTLLVMSLVLVLDVAHNMVTGQPEDVYKRQLPACRRPGRRTPPECPTGR